MTRMETYLLLAVAVVAVTAIFTLGVAVGFLSR